MEKLRQLIKEMVIEEFVNPKLSQRLSYIIEQLNEVYETAISAEGNSKRESDIVQLQRAIEILNNVNRHMGRLGRG